jgi:hypothetical protein
LEQKIRNGRIAIPSQQNGSIGTKCSVSWVVNIFSIPQENCGTFSMFRRGRIEPINSPVHPTPIGNRAIDIIKLLISPCPFLLGHIEPIDLIPALPIF